MTMTQPQMNFYFQARGSAAHRGLNATITFGVCASDLPAGEWGGGSLS